MYTQFNFPAMLELLRIIAIIAIVVFLLNNGTIVRSARFCDYSSYKVSTCPGDDQLGIRDPFWIQGLSVDQYGDCTSFPEFQIGCAANGRPVIKISNDFYYVLNIDYDKGSLTLMDVATDAQECPQPRRNISIESLRFIHFDDAKIVKMTIFYNCSSHPKNVVQRIPCLDNNNNNNTGTGGRSFAFLDEEISSHGFNWYQNCEETVVVPVILPDAFVHNRTNMNYTQALKRGIGLDWHYPVDCEDCKASGGKCWANETDQDITTPFHCNCTDGTTLVDARCPYTFSDGYPSYRNGLPIRLKIILGVSIGVGGGVLLILLVIYQRNCWSLYNSTASSCRKKIKGPTNVELFLDNNNGGLSSHSYKYSDIKKMTNSFKDTLGQGGYGSVFKGKLRDGRLVAVKVLNESKGKGEDFINELATIGRTNHVNVASLLGFCAEGTKRALVYEFMPNGSLEKFIHNAKDSSTTSFLLGWEKLYQIALGIARGLEYLHRGCNTRILHFDIKPHNILLDQDFCPKISDFGLAKLCPTRESLVSMVGARGTPGYMAPEVYYPSFGGVSHKSDVYSYGMMVLEMIGGRKNMDILVENASQIYFPQWIYKRLSENIKVERSEIFEATVVPGEVFEEEIVRKMIIVALWSIQTHPRDRPSITKVVEMLEGNTEDLQLPPNPFPNPSSNSFSLP